MDEKPERFVAVWPWDDAPKQYRALSTHGGDEDWVAFVPDRYRDLWIPWLDSGTPFGFCDVEIHHVEGGTVHIGAHS